MKSANSINYQGEVTFSTKMNKRVYQTKKFNKGTKYVSDLFSTAVLGLSWGEGNDAVKFPQYIDFGYFTSDASGGTDWKAELDLNSFVSMLSVKSALTGRTSIISQAPESLGWRFPKFDAVIYINRFTEKQSGYSPIHACLKDENDHIIAMVNTGVQLVSGDADTSLFGDSNNLVVNWVMKLYNATDTVSDVSEESGYPETNTTAAQQETTEEG